MIDEEKNPWTSLSTRVHYDNPWIRVTEHQVITPSGGSGIYGVVHFKNHAIGIIPVDEEGNTWLVGQYRFPLDAYSWEIPEGGGPLDKPVLDSAKRELEEECGIRAEHWELILETDLSNCVGDERGYVYVARGLSFVDSHPDETEKLAVRKLPLTEVFEMAAQGKIRDGLSLLGLMALRLRLGDAP